MEKADKIALAQLWFKQNICKKNAKNHAKMDKNAKKWTKKAKTAWQKQKLAHMWKISNCGAAAAAIFFHLCPDVSALLNGDWPTHNDWYRLIHISSPPNISSAHQTLQVGQIITAVRITGCRICHNMHFCTVQHLITKLKKKKIGKIWDNNLLQSCDILYFCSDYWYFLFKFS